jgi:ribonuclease BN (tRNA processing enzyme)
MSELTFLGTAGGRMVVASQIRKSGGMWLALGDRNVLLDPGPGCLLRCAELGLRPYRIDCIVLSHRHIDHSNDVNIMAEAMSGGGFRPRGMLIAPRDCLYGEDPVVLKYVRKYIQDNILILKEGFRHSLDGVAVEGALRLRHSDVESYAIKFSFDGRTLGYIADTKYFDGIGEAMKGCDFLIVNMVRITYDDRFQHLIPGDVEKILKVARPGMAIMNHFGMQVVKARPREIAYRIEKATGVRTIAAEDGMRLRLDRREEKTTTLSEYIK